MSRARRWVSAVGALDLLLLYLPILVLILFSFNASKFSAVWHGFTFRWYAALLEDASLLAALQNSLVVASVSTVLATVLGLLMALGLRHRADLPALVLLPLVIPEVMLGVALLLFFVLIKLPLGLGTIILAHTTFNLPIVVVVLHARLRKLDPSLEEAAQDLGATWWQTVLAVTLPLLRPAIMGAMLMAFTSSLDDFIVTFFTAGPGASTVPLKVYSMLRAGLSPVINALSAVLVVASMALIALSLLLQRERLDSPR